MDDEVLKRGLEVYRHRSCPAEAVFISFNTTRMHVWNHLKKELQGVTGVGLYPDGWQSTTRPSAPC